MAQYREFDDVPFPDERDDRSSYNPKPKQDYPPPYDGHFSPAQYPAQPQPPPMPMAPPVMQQQQSNNVIVVGNQPTQRVNVHIEEVNDRLLITFFLFVCCLLLGNVPIMLCLFPALIFSCMASTYRDAGENDLANRFGSLACKCNMVAIIPAIIVLVVGVVVGVVVLLIVLGLISI